MSHTTLQSAHIPVLDHLRGTAALLVFVCHFGPILPYIVVDDQQTLLTFYGAYGVEMFFAISGFIIPFSMFQRGHTIRQSGSFLLRRMARLEPPYLACIALILALNAITLWRAGNGPTHAEVHVTLPQLLAHLGYLNAILGFPWLNPVFWTLAIEFQFYLFCLVAYPIISSSSRRVRVVSLISFALIGLTAIAPRFPHSPLLPYWLPLFALGMITCCMMTGLLDRIHAAAAFAVSAGIALAVNGPLSTAFAMFPLCLIVLLNNREPWKLLKPLAWAGTISYSLYLLHLPIGLRLAGHVRNRVPTNMIGNFVIFATVFAAVLSASWLFNRLVERPSQRWSKTFGKKIRRTETDPDSIPAPENLLVENSPSVAHRSLQRMDIHA